jgi:hypothetical protein
MRHANGSRPFAAPETGLLSLARELGLLSLGLLSVAVHGVASLVVRACEAVLDYVIHDDRFQRSQAAVAARKAAAKATHAKEEEATLRYLHRFARCCPRCKARIVKDEGCDHMVCWCGNAFNWSEARYGQPR